MGVDIWDNHIPKVKIYMVFRKSINRVTCLEEELVRIVLALKMKRKGNGVSGTT